MASSACAAPLPQSLAETPVVSVLAVGGVRSVGKWDSSVAPLDESQNEPSASQQQYTELGFPVFAAGSQPSTLVCF